MGQGEGSPCRRSVHGRHDRFEYVRRLSFLVNASAADAPFPSLYILTELAALEPLRVASLTLAVTTAGHGIRRKLPPLDGLELTARTLFENELERYMLMLYPPSWLDDVDADDPQGRTNRETRIEEHLRRVKVTSVRAVQEAPCALLHISR